MTFEDAIWIGLGLKVDKEITVTPTPCPHCLGAGELEIAPEKTHHGIAYMRCLSCNGTGVLEDAETPMGCSYCRATYVAKDWQDRGSCPYCYSSNVYQRVS